VTGREAAAGTAAAAGKSFARHFSHGALVRRWIGPSTSLDDADQGAADKLNLCFGQLSRVCLVLASDHGGAAGLMPARVAI
jgi:hypothetical protein